MISGGMHSSIHIRRMYYLPGAQLTGGVKARSIAHTPGLVIQPPPRQSGRWDVKDVSVEASRCEVLVSAQPPF